MVNIIKNFIPISILTAIFTTVFTYYLNRNRAHRDTINKIKVENILEGYHNFISLLPDIAEKTEHIYNCLTVYKKTIQDIEFFDEKALNPEESTFKSLMLTLHKLDKIIKQTDKFSADLLYFDIKSFNKYVEFTTYILDSENAKNKNYLEFSENKLIDFLKTFSKNFSLHKIKDFQNIDWFTTPLRYNVININRSLIEKKEINR